MLKKIGISLLAVICGYIILALVLTKSDAKQLKLVQESVPPPSFCPIFNGPRNEIDSIAKLTKETMAMVKGIPKEYEDILFFTLHYFPELKDVPIEIIYESIPTTMQTQPSAKFIYRGDRSYKISINSNPEFEGIFFDDIPFDGKVGIVAHELCHIIDYEHKSDIQIVGTGLKFLRKKSQERYEKSIDMLTIYKGFGFQLREWARFSMEESDATNAYKTFKKKVYLEPEEISKEMERMNICSPSGEPHSYSRPSTWDSTRLLR